MSPVGAGTPGAPSGAPRRAQPGIVAAPTVPPRGRLARRIAAPLALLAVGGLGFLVLASPSVGEPFFLTDPQYAAQGAVVESRSTSTPDESMGSRDEERTGRPSAGADDPAVAVLPVTTTSAGIAARTANSAAIATPSAGVSAPSVPVDVATPSTAPAPASDPAPIEATSSPSVPSDPRSASAAPTAVCAAAPGVEDGLTVRAVEVLRAVCDAFPSVDGYVGYSADVGSLHAAGRAIDVTASGKDGWEIARWARANAADIGITEVVFAQRIWTTEQSNAGWRWMPDDGDATADHSDGVHIGVA